MKDNIKVIKITEKTQAMKVAGITIMDLKEYRIVIGVYDKMFGSVVIVAAGYHIGDGIRFQMDGSVSTFSRLQRDCGGIRLSGGYVIINQYKGFLWKRKRKSSTQLQLEIEKAVAVFKDFQLLKYKKLREKKKAINQVLKFIPNKI